MRKWETVLERDTEAYDDLIEWLTHMRDVAFSQLAQGTSAEHDRKAGIVDGIGRVLFQVVANRKERKSNAAA